MRRFFASFFLASVCLLVVGVFSVSAQSPRNYYDWSTTLEVNQHILGAQTTALPIVSPFQYFIGADFTPAHPFYFIKTVEENVALVFTFAPAKKEELRLAIAEEKAQELKDLATSTNAAAIKTASEGYKRYMEDAVTTLEQLKAQNTDVKDLVKKVESQTAKDAVVLNQVEAQVPEDAIDTALEANWKGTDTAADLSGRPAVPPDVVARIQALKAQGLLTEEEAAKLIGSKNRIEARSELKKYVQEGVVSEADFTRLNENVKALYPEEFYKMHEVKRFFELQKLESEKPDTATLAKIEDFQKTYIPGDIVPSNIRRFWVPVIRLEELQNTLRPDLIDPNLFKNKQDDFKKFNELIERFKPRPEDVAYVKNYIEKNNAQVNDLPPEYQRMYNLAQRYGAQCGVGYKWTQGSNGGGYCAKDGEAAIGDVPKTEDFAKGKSCSGQVVGARGPGGACSAYPSDCIPPGWTNVGSCTSTTSVTSGSSKSITCPSNAHFVPVPWDPQGGYCIPNYTAVGGFDATTGTTETACGSGYVRRFPGGPCLQENSNTQFTNSGVRITTLHPLTLTPGGPSYPGGGRCGNGAHFVPEPINPNGGYCAPDNYNPGFGSGQITPFPGNGLPKADMGNCRTPGECYDYCKAHPTEGDCKYQNPNSSRPGDTSTPSREAQDAACRAGGGTCSSWNNGTCSCTGYKSGGGQTGPTPPGPVCQLYCPNGYVPGACACKSGDSGGGGGVSREAQDAACRAGGGTCTGWNNGACSCEHYNSTSGGGAPSGYGQCGSGMRWNGSYCVSEASSTNFTQEDPATACARGSGCTWTGSSCNCPSQPQQQTQTQTAPTSAPQQQTQTQTPQTMDPATECAKYGGTWANNTCTGAH